MRRVLTLAAAAVVLATAPARAENFPVPGEGIGDYPRPETFRVLVGDVDGFQAGDPLDDPALSPDCNDILAFCEAQPGMSAHACLDDYGDDRPVGITIPFQVPDGARVVSAELTFEFLAVSQFACNDFVLSTPNDYPAYALLDMIGCEPDLGQVYKTTIDLSHVPTRTMGAPAWDGHWSGPPNGYTNLVLAMRRNGRLDLVFGDDVSIDYAALRVTWEYPIPPPPGDKVPILVTPNPGGSGDQTLSFALSRRAAAVIEVFDITGRRVATPASEVMGPGALRVVWDGRTSDGVKAMPGTYFVRLRTEEGSTGAAKILRVR